MKAVTLAAIALLSAGKTHAEPRALVPAWVSSTSFKPAKFKDGEAENYNAQSVRQDIRVQTATSKVTLRLTNELGSAPVTLDRVELRKINADGSLGEPHLAKFGGAEGVTLAPGFVGYTDFVDMPLAAFSDVAVTVHYPGAAEPVAHRAMVRIADGPATPTADSKLVRGAAIVSSIETQAPEAKCRRVVVALGDSITEGAGSTAHNNWPSRLARRLYGRGCEVVVVNAGISGNKVLANGGSPGLLTRLDRDVLAVPGVTDILFVEGVNDVRAAEASRFDPNMEADKLLEAYRQLVLRAHAHGIRVIGGTLTPYKGTNNQTADGLATVDRVNAVIRSGKVFDAVVDFNQALADPNDPQRMRTDLQKGDWLHPNDAGYAAMAEAIPEMLLLPLPARRAARRVKP